MPDQAVSDARFSRISASFDRQSMMTTLGAKLDAVGEGSCRIIAPIKDTARQQQGFGHAALTFALGDTSAGYAALSLMEADHEVLTAEIKINLLAPASGDRLVADGRVIKPGKRLIVVTSDVFAETNGDLRHIAVLQGTMVPVAL